ncbi:MAG TPA: 2OG-Fe(II) oxygenase [Candidatus Acidoferrum sp.]|nr:2OG-Fe(II) oxygenase [Candidatus Acidoferrum sp.]
MIDALAKQGFAIVDDLLPPRELQALIVSAQRHLDRAGKSAGIGRGGDLQVDVGVRGDRIAWLDEGDAASAAFVQHMEQLRLELNRSLYLGLFRYESHFACYEPGAFYRKHVDAFKGERSRLVSSVFYLNENWRTEDGGELVLYRGDADEIAATVLPARNRLVVFLSEEFPHEVKPASRRRYSIAGWFRGA